MSKDNVFKFFTKAAKDEQLKDKLQTVKDQSELVNLGNQEGFEFSSEHVEEALTDLKQKPGFFRALADAVFSVFSPAHDDYPSIGVQPFSGDPNRRD